MTTVRCGVEQKAGLPEVARIEMLKESVLLLVASEFYATYAPALLTLQKIITDATQNQAIIAKSTHDRVMRRKRKHMRKFAQQIQEWNMKSGPETLSQDPQCKVKILSMRDGADAMAFKYGAVLGKYLQSIAYLDRQDRDLRRSLLKYGLLRFNRSFNKSFQQFTKRLLRKLCELAMKCTDQEIATVYPILKGIKKLIVVQDPFRKIRIVQRICQKSVKQCGEKMILTGVAF